MSRHTTGSLIVGGAAVIWGFIALIVREIDMPSLAIVFWRDALGAATIGLYALVIGRRALLRFPSLVVVWLGLLLSVHWVCFFLAIRETSVASAVLITYASPILIALIAPRMIGERVPRATIWALGISIAGVVAIGLAGGSGAEAVRPLGVALALGAAVTAAFLFVLVKRAASALDPVTVTFWQTTVISIVTLPAAFAGGYRLDGPTIGYVLALGVATTGVAGLMFVSAIRWIPATTAGILGYMEPVSAAILAALLLGEALTAPVVAGGVAILAAGVIVALSSPEPPPVGIDEAAVAGARAS